jgi:glycosyltransferase involved in cell wall biosynthesis
VAGFRTEAGGLDESRISLMPRNLLIITPVLPPAPGGGAAYTMILANGLLTQRLAERIVVVAEKHPIMPDLEVRHDGCLQLLRILPFRAGRAMRDVTSYIAYLWQQVYFWRLFRIVREHAIDTVLVHSSLLYRPNTLRTIIRWLKRRTDIRLVLDVRDPLALSALFDNHREFDRIVCCSRLLEKRMGARLDLGSKVMFIPIPIEPVARDETRIAATLARHGLRAGGYLFNGNGLSRAKSVDLLVEAVRLLHQRGYRWPLVIAGRERDMDDFFKAAVRRGELHSLGPVDHATVIDLAAAAAGVINPSRIDTPSRFSIEGLMVEAPSLLPREVPEFEMVSPKLVCAGTATDLADQITALLRGDLAPSRYDVGIHHPDRVIPLYKALFEPSLTADQVTTAPI